MEKKGCGGSAFPDWFTSHRYMGIRAYKYLHNLLHNMKLQKTKVGCFITSLPKAVVDSMDWKEGIEIEVKTLGKDRLELRKK